MSAVLSSGKWFLYLWNNFTVVPLWRLICFCFLVFGGGKIWLVKKASRCFQHLIGARNRIGCSLCITIEIPASFSYFLKPVNNYKILGFYFFLDKSKCIDYRINYFFFLIFEFSFFLCWQKKIVTVRFLGVGRFGGGGESISFLEMWGRTPYKDSKTKQLLKSSATIFEIRREKGKRWWNF